MFDSLNCQHIRSGVVEILYYKNKISLFSIAENMFETLLCCYLPIQCLGGADVLEIEGNTFGDEGIESLTDVMCENIRIKSLVRSSLYL